MNTKIQGIVKRCQAENHEVQDGDGYSQDQQRAALDRQGTFKPPDNTTSAMNKFNQPYACIGLEQT